MADILVLPRNRQKDRALATNSSAWRKLRAQQLRKEPLCRHCNEKGLLTEATDVDHINGDAYDDSPDNHQSLCRSCHSRKTAIEDCGFGNPKHVQTHPEWLPKPACPVVLVTGPPGAGKTTYCLRHAKPDDEVIDLDECFRMVCGVHGHEADRKHLKAAIWLRNKLIANLASKKTGKAYLIVAAPPPKEVLWWTHKLGAQHVLVDPGVETCVQRVTGRRREAAIDWYARHKADDWSPPTGSGFNESGIPTDPTHHWAI